MRLSTRIQDRDVKFVSDVVATHFSIIGTLIHHRNHIHKRLIIGAHVEYACGFIETVSAYKQLVSQNQTKMTIILYRACHAVRSLLGASRTCAIGGPLTKTTLHFSLDFIGRRDCRIFCIQRARTRFVSYRQSVDETNMSSNLKRRDGGTIRGECVFAQHASCQRD